MDEVHYSMQVHSIIPRRIKLKSFVFYLTFDTLESNLGLSASDQGVRVEELG
jgi:hypothetical protein